MESFLAELRRHLEQLEAQCLLRRLRTVSPTGRRVDLAGRPLINLSSNDYLALSQHPRLKAAASEAVERFGVGAGASRLVVGHQPLHAELEEQFAHFKHAQAALLLPTGYMANWAVLTTFAQRGDLICIDKLCHASLIDAARASGAHVRTYPHLQTEKLQRLLVRNAPAAKQEPSSSGRAPRSFIVTDSVFSMDGDVADLPSLCDLAEAHQAILVVDEAHGTGVLGPDGTGLCELQQVQHRVHIVVSTASKAFGSLGGIVTSRREVIDTLINRARVLIYTTAVPPAQAAAILEALKIVHDEPWRRHRLTQLSQHLREQLTARGWSIPPTTVATPIIPLIVGTAEKALALAAHLQDHGLLAVAIRPPTVPPGSSRVRITLRADLEDADVTRLCDALSRFNR
jgi:8-amino-7-oxononanoate synthase